MAYTVPYDSFYLEYVFPRLPQGICDVSAAIALRGSRYCAGDVTGCRIGVQKEVDLSTAGVGHTTHLGQIKHSLKTVFKPCWFNTEIGTEITSFCRIFFLADIFPLVENTAAMNSL